MNELLNKEISETLKSYLNQFISVRIVNSESTLVGTLQRVESDHILLKGEHGSNVIIATSQIVSVVAK